MIRRKFLASAATALGGLLISKKVEAQAWKKLQVGTPPPTLGPQIWAWGNPDCGALGNNDTINPKSIPIAVCGSITSVVSIAAGLQHGLSLLSNGTLKAWGYGSDGELGDSSTASKPTPVAVCGITTAVGIAVGGYHNLAILSNGTVQAWGLGCYAQIGDGACTNRNSPVSVSCISTATAVSAGRFHSLALLSNGTLMAWGSGAQGQIGNATNPIRQITPAVVSNISTAIAIAGGDTHSVALLADGTVKAWGYGGQGQLGNNLASNRNTPVAVCGISTAIAIAAMGDFTLALLSSGTVMAWGYGGEGQLGNGALLSKSTPVAVCGISTAVAISSGTNHSLALLASGSLVSWGYGAGGRLGNGSTSDASTPVAVCTLSNAYGSIGFTLTTRNRLPQIASGGIHSYFYHRG